MHRLRTLHEQQQILPSFLSSLKTIFDVVFRSVKRKQFPPQSATLRVTIHAAKRIYDIVKRATVQYFTCHPTRLQKLFFSQVIRKSTGAMLFHSNLPGFVYSDQFIQIPTSLASTAVYGLGENEQKSYRHDLNWMTWVGYAR
jgi:hypothetical protein